MHRLRRRSVTAAIIVIAVLVLSGCGFPNIVKESRDESIRNAATAFSETVDCFEKLRITTGEDLDALARQNGLCGNWTALGASDEELSIWKWDDTNVTWLIRISESDGEPIVQVLTVGDGQAQSWEQREVHTLILCWQATLDLSGGKPHVTGFECPEQWLASWGAAEEMTIKELKAATSELGMTLSA